MSLAPFLAAILDHWRSPYSVCKRDDWHSHFVVTGERGSGHRKCALSEVTAAYSHGSKHNGGSGQGEKRIKKFGANAAPTMASSAMVHTGTQPGIDCELLSSIHCDLESVFLANRTFRPLHQPLLRLSQLLRPVLQHVLVFFDSRLDVGVQRHFLPVKLCQHPVIVDVTRGSHHMIFDLANECMLRSVDVGRRI